MPLKLAAQRAERILRRDQAGRLRFLLAVPKGLQMLNSSRGGNGHAVRTGWDERDRDRKRRSDAGLRDQAALSANPITEHGAQTFKPDVRRVDGADLRIGSLVKHHRRACDVRGQVLHHKASHFDGASHKRGVSQSAGGKVEPMDEFPRRIAARAHPQVAEVLLTGHGTSPVLLANLLLHVGPVDATPGEVADLVGRCLLLPDAKADPELAALRAHEYLAQGQGHAPPGSRLLAASALLRELGRVLIASPQPSE
ncbi:MAG: hypothetical protein U0R70_11135 [Solirubrobacteraceae bacterium]